jgi:hypothetical protein
MYALVMLRVFVILHVCNEYENVCNWLVCGSYKLIFCKFRVFLFVM